MYTHQTINNHTAQRGSHVAVMGPAVRIYGLVLLAVFFLCLCVCMIPQGARAFDLPTTLSISICGDGIVNAGEVCDDGVGGNIGGYGSSTAERKCIECTAFGPYCGDGILQVRFLEQCDDGNNATADLCSPSCIEEIPTPPGSSGSPTRGSTPAIPGGVQGAIQSSIETKVVLRGKAYPNSDVNILLDGKVKSIVRADANADFVYSATDVTPGTASFGFWAKDQEGIESITTSVVFDVVQSAVTTVANIFLPPTIKLSERQIQPGGLLTISGQAVPKGKVMTEIHAGTPTALSSESDLLGKWALQVDTKSLSEGFHTAKAQAQLTETAKSGFGRSVSFYIGDEMPADGVSSDINGDSKVNLIDFSIFLTHWGTDDSSSDFNLDGKVNLADFSMMLFNWTG